MEKEGSGDFSVQRRVPKAVAHFRGSAYRNIREPTVLVFSSRDDRAREEEKLLYSRRLLLFSFLGLSCSLSPSIALPERPRLCMYECMYVECMYVCMYVSTHKINHRQACDACFRPVLFCSQLLGRKRPHGPARPGLRWP